MQGPFDVLAGAQAVGSEVETGAEIVAGLLAAQGQPVNRIAFGVAYRKIRPYRMAPEVGKFEALLLSELPAKADLPLPQAHFLRLFVVTDAFGFLLFLFSAVLCLGHGKAMNCLEYLEVTKLKFFLLKIEVHPTG